MINSIVLVSNGISFAIPIVPLLVIGSYASTECGKFGMFREYAEGILDFGHSRAKILITLSIIASTTGFAWMGVHTANNSMLQPATMTLKSNELPPEV